MYRFLVTAMAVFSLVSCSKSDSSDEQKEVSFDKFIGTWTGVREMTTENNVQVQIEECEKQITVNFLKIQTVNAVKFIGSCKNSEESGMGISIKNNTLVDIETNQPAFTYSFENNNLLKVETIKPVPFFNFEPYNTELNKITEETGKAPTPEQILELTKKHTLNVKIKAVLNRK